MGWRDCNSPGYHLWRVGGSVYHLGSGASQSVAPLVVCLVLAHFGFVMVAG